MEHNYRIPDHPSLSGIFAKQASRKNTVWDMVKVLALALFMTSVGFCLAFLMIYISLLLGKTLFCIIGGLAIFSFSFVLSCQFLDIGFWK